MQAAGGSPSHDSGKLTGPEMMSEAISDPGAGALAIIDSDGRQWPVLPCHRRGPLAIKEYVDDPDHYIHAVCDYKT